MAFENCATRSVLITRPQVDVPRLAEKLNSCGFNPIVDSMLTVEYLSTPIITYNISSNQNVLPNLIHACIITSKQAIWALSKYNVPFDTPIFVVASVTAALIRQQGYFNVMIGDGRAESLISLIVKHKIHESANIVYFCGYDTRFDFVPVLAKLTYNVIKVIVYKTHSVKSLQDNTISMIQHNKIIAILFYSPKTVRTFCCLAAKINLKMDKVIAICLSPVIAQTISLPFAKIIAAGYPNDDTMIKTLQHEISYG